MVSTYDHAPRSAAGFVGALSDPARGGAPVDADGARPLRSVRGQSPGEAFGEAGQLADGLRRGRAARGGAGSAALADREARPPEVWTGSAGLTVHAEDGHRRPPYAVELMSGPAAELVLAHAGLLPHVQIVLTTPARMATRAVAGHMRLLGGRLGPDTVLREVRSFGRLAASRAGLCLPVSGAGALVLLNSRWVRRPGALAATLLHELTHAAQLERPGVLARFTAHLERVHGLAPDDPAEDESHCGLLAAEEEEAYRMESFRHDLLGSVPPDLARSLATG